MDRNRIGAAFINMRVGFSIFVLLFLASTLAPGLAEAGPVSISGKPVPALDLFEKGEIPRVRVELSDDAIERLRASPRKYVVGAVVDGTQRYTNVSIRL